jgi:hypothetical protein
MKNQLQKSLMQGIKDLHIKILQSNDLPEIGNYLQEILDKILSVPPVSQKKLLDENWTDLSKSGIISALKSDIKSILDGAYSRVEVARHQATLDIAWLKSLFSDPLAQ